MRDAATTKSKGKTLRPGNAEEAEEAEVFGVLPRTEK